MWHETPEDIEAGLAWGVKKKRLLRWVRRRMTDNLSPVERRSIEMYFFKAMKKADIARATQTSPAAVHRAVRRALRKLRVLGEKSTLRDALKEPQQEEDADD
jgi:DNA-directed RNA polymerase specialized sigma24 family protein